MAVLESESLVALGAPVLGREPGRPGPDPWVPEPRGPDLPEPRLPDPDPWVPDPSPRPVPEPDVPDSTPPV